MRALNTHTTHDVWTLSIIHTSIQFMQIWIYIQVFRDTCNLLAEAELFCFYKFLTDLKEQHELSKLYCSTRTTLLRVAYYVLCYVIRINLSLQVHKSHTSRGFRIIMSSKFEHHNLKENMSPSSHMAHRLGNFDNRAKVLAACQRAMERSIPT